MNAKEIVIDDELMEELRELSIEKGTSLEEEIEKHNYLFSEECERIRMKEMSPALAAFCGIMGKVPDDYDWKAEYHEGMYQKYMSIK